MGERKKNEHEQKEKSSQFSLVRGPLGLGGRRVEWGRGIEGMYWF